MEPDKGKKDKDQKKRDAVDTPNPPQRKNPNEGLETQKKDKKKST
jgi:hypothetical protein